MAYLKLKCSQTDSGSHILARLFSGESAEKNSYSGTVVLPRETFEMFLDALVYGAGELHDLDVYFGPDLAG